MRKFTTLFTAAFLGAALSASAQTVLEENFEATTGSAIPATWSQQKKATTGWKSNSGSLAFTAGWAVPAGSRYAVVDEWNNNEDNDTTRLVSPTFDLTGVTGTWLTYNSYFVRAAYTSGTPVEDAFVFISTDGGTTWSVVDTVNPGNTDWEFNAVNLGAYDNMNNLKLAFSYHDGKGATNKLIGFAVDNIKVYVPPTKELALTAITPGIGSLLAYGVAGGTIPIGGVVYNNGGQPVTSYTVHYQLASNTVVSDVITGVNIAPFSSAEFTNPTSLAIPSALGNYPVKMWVELAGDALATNDSANTNATAVSFMPKKKIFIEEGTGTWCGWCPRGHVYMDSVFHTYKDNFSLVAVHNQDPMTLASYDQFLGSIIAGYPSIAVDRREELDPSNLIDVYNFEKNYFGFADITLADQGAESFNFKVKVSVKPAMDLSGDYRLALILTEDKVTGTGSSWDQTNYYSYQQANIPLAGAGINWNSEPAKVPAEKMVYEFVARATVPSATGAAGSLPTTMTAGTTYDYDFTTTIPQPFNRNNMRAIAILIRNSDGAVLNSNNMQVPLGVSNVAASVERMRVYPNPATDKANIDFTINENTTVSVMVYDAIGRVVTTIAEQSFEKGTHNLSINTTNLAAGLYNIKLQTSKGVVSEQLSVVK